MQKRTAWIPLATAFLLFAVLAISATRGRRQITSLVQQRDSAIARTATIVREHGDLLAAGDSLPSIVLQGIRGGNVDLRALPPQFKYLYFGRADCPGCILLRPFIERLPQPSRDSLVIIAYHPDSNAAEVQRAGADFSWVHGSNTRRRFVLFIPTLIVRAPDNRVLSVAHGSLVDVASLFDLFGLVSRREVVAALDAAMARARREGSIIDTGRIAQ